MAKQVSSGEAGLVELIVGMKTFLAVLLATSCTAAALAGNGDSGKRLPIKTAVVTGTNIARPVKRIGNTYDTPQAIHVIDRARIEQSGAGSVAQLLRRYPGISIR